MDIKMRNTESLCMFLVLVSIYILKGGNGEVIRCIEEEKQALLRFKQEVGDQYNVLWPWGTGENKSECCSWPGIVCSNMTGRVIVVELPRYYSYMRCTNGLVIQNLDWLSNLSSLFLLDLGCSNFTQSLETVVFRVISKIPSLKELSLSMSHFPNDTSFVDVHASSASSSLYYLYLSGVSLTSSAFHWLFNISTSLVSIDLSGNMLDGPIPDAFGQKFVFLEYLDLSRNRFQGGIPKSLQNLRRLKYLRISYNNLTGPLNEFIGTMVPMEALDLSHNNLDGPIPDALGQKFVLLEYLDLSHNRFQGGIPKFLQHLRSLKVINLSYNNLTGPLPEFIGTLVSMEALDLSYNKLDGPIPDSFGQEFVFLEYLEEGEIPRSLKSLNLSHNQITGSLPESVGELSELESLIVSYNSLEGEVSESHLSNLHSLKVLDLSHNSLVLNLTPDWTPPFHLDTLKLASCNLGPRFPAWVHSQSNVSFLDLSATNISDEAPETFWYSFPRLLSLNLSYNHISGELPALSSKLLGHPDYLSLDLSFNEFSGYIPSFRPKNMELLLSNNKFVGEISFVCRSKFNAVGTLDLSNNQLSGQLPNCWENFSLNLLNLSNNTFSGKIPNYMGSQLTALFLGNNNLSGELPSGLSNNSRYMFILDVGGNKLTGNIPTWIGTNLGMLSILNTRGNNFFGSIPPEICHLTLLHVLDLSENNLSGRIPLHCFDNFTYLVPKSGANKALFFWNLMDYASMVKVAVQWKGRDSEFDFSRMLPLLGLIDLSSNRLEGDIPTEIFKLGRLNSLNLSRNHLTGNIKPEIHMMGSLEILDLSRNQLSGEIPASLGTLSSLNNLDLSNNNLSGKIPSGTQLQSFPASRFDGNIGLCGDPLPRCPQDEPRPSSGKVDNGNGDDAFTNRSFIQEFYITIVLGFIVGFWGLIGTLLVKKSWRYAYFNFFDRIYDYVCLKVALYRRRLSRLGHTHNIQT